MTDYLSMNDYDAYTHCGADARRWADWFSQVAATHGLKIEADWMETWFANAMMARVDFDQRAEITDADRFNEAAALGMQIPGVTE